MNVPVSMQKQTKYIRADYDFAKPKSAYVFKTIVDPFIGKYSLIKVNSGVLKADDVLYNAAQGCRGEDRKTLCTPRATSRIEVTELHAGDIGAIGKTFRSRQQPILYRQKQIRSCIFRTADLHTIYMHEHIKQRIKVMRIRFPRHLQRLMQEDLTLKVVNDQ